MKTTDNQNELFIVVDENDNVVDYRTRGECHSDKSLIHRSVQIVLFDNEGKVLMQKRSMTKDLYPGYFTVSASRHVDKGESYESTAKRELFEEIGLDVPLEFKTKFLLKNTLESEYVALFTGKFEGELKLNASEVETVEYVAPQDVESLRSQIAPTAIRSFEELGIL